MRSSIILFLASTALTVTPTWAADEAATDAADAAEAQDIIVIGKGETRQVQEIGAEDIAILAPGTSPLKAIEKLPSVNFQSADPFGNYEWSQRISIRGFNQNQLGFTFDGIPLGDGTYGNHNGLHVSRAIAPENIALTRVSQGAGSIGTQATNNLGGTLEFFSLDPKDGFGVDANLTYGSENTMRGFARVNFGEADKARGFISGSYHNAEKWKGAGKQKNWMINAKGIVPLGGAEIDAYFSRSDRAEQDYQDLSLGMIARLGYDWDNFFPDYALAIQVADIAANRGESGAVALNPAAGTTYPAPVATVDDAYFDASGLRKDTLAAVGLKAPIGDALTFRVKGYYHGNKGQGTWGTPYVASPNGVPMSIRTTEYDLNRKGMFASIAAELGAQDITVGAWYENNKFNQARRFYAYQSLTAAGRDHLKFQHDPFFTQWEFDFTTDTLQYYVQDKIKLGDSTTVNLGWKGFQVKNKADAVIAGGRAAGKIRSKDWFQPHVGVAQKLSDKAELFGGFTQVTRAFVSSTTSGPFSTTQAGFDAIKGTLKPEESDTFELGARYNDSKINAMVGVYHVNFRNRLLGISTGAGIVGNPAVLQNVGGVRAQGFEAAVDYKLGNGIGLFASYSFNDTTYRDNVVNAAGTLLAATKGKTVVDAPKHLLRGEMSYESDSLFGRIGVNYMSRRYFTYENDQSVAGRALVDAAIGYKLDAGLRSPLEIQLNATNLFDKKYVATVGSNGFGNRGDNQTLLAGSPRQLFVTLKGGF